MMSRAIAERVRAIEKRAVRPAWNWKQLATRDIPWLVEQLKKAYTQRG